MENLNYRYCKEVIYDIIVRLYILLLYNLFACHSKLKFVNVGIVVGKNGEF